MNPQRNIFRIAMARKFMILLAALLCLPVASRAVSPYPVLSERADRFFSQKEWNQAAAVYGLMLDERPEVPQTYGRAIVAEGMRGDRAAQQRLMARALDHHVPFDSVFSRVREFSFSLGKTNLYADFLLSLKEQYPWMKRTIDSYLLQYYTFRRNGTEMLRLSDAMLAGAPDNLGFLTLRAKGYIYEGEFDKAMDTCRRILELDPDNYEALLTLGNYHIQRDQPAQALPLLERAYMLRPTPYVATQLERLGVKG